MFSTTYSIVAKYLEINQYRLPANSLTAEGNPIDGFEVNIESYISDNKIEEKNGLYDLIDKALCNSKISKQLRIVYKEEGPTEFSQDFYFIAPTFLRCFRERNSEDLCTNLTFKFRCRDIERLSDETVDLVD